MANPKLWTGVGSPQSIYESSTVQYHPIGSRGGLDDGRVFYYARNGAADILPGKLVMSEVITDQFDDMALPTDGFVAGEKSCTLTLGSTAVTENEYADGYVIVSDGTGEGHTYKIAGHLAGLATADVVFTLYDEVKVSSVAATQAVLAKNLWADVVIAAAGHVHVAVGVPQTTITAAEYGWVQTWGVSAVWDDATTAVGQTLQSGATAGQVEIGDGTAQVLGTAMSTATAAEDYTPKLLTIAP
jgi:hypothetical protein